MAPDSLSTRAVADRYRVCRVDGDFLASALMSSLAFVASVVANFYAGLYATHRASNPVTDIVLSNMGPFPLDGVFVYGTFALVGFFVVLLLRNPARIPFTLYSFALFYFVRAIFVTLTHIGPVPVPQTEDFGPVVTTFFFGGDRFFSGHTGAPFLMALIFWRDCVLRGIFLASSIAFGVVVLLAHLHYTIDVAAAFFVAYGVFRMAQHYFEKADASLVRRPA